MLWERFGQRDLYGNRKEMTLSAVAMARERPAAGWGLGTFQYVYPAYALFDDDMLVNHAHNDWAEWTAEGGLPFLAFMLAVAGPLSGRLQPAEPAGGTVLLPAARISGGVRSRAWFERRWA